MKTDETLQRILDAEKLMNEFNQVIRANKDCKDLGCEQIYFNKKYNLPLSSEVGKLLAIGKESDSERDLRKQLEKSELMIQQLKDIIRSHGILLININ